MSTLLCCASFLLCVASRSHAFAFCQAGSFLSGVGQDNNMHVPRSTCRGGGKVGAAQALRTTKWEEEQQQGTTRAGIARIMGGAFAGTLAVNALPCAAARSREDLVSLSAHRDG